MTSFNRAVRAQLAWQTARRCDGGACVQVARYREMIVVGDTKNPDGPLLCYARDRWQEFLDNAKKGDFDTLV
jgi:hypothetical protein